MFRTLGLGELKLTSVSLQLADRSIKYLRGVIEYVLVKMKKLYFPADFIVLDMEEEGKYLSFWDVHFLQWAIH